jgi:putative hydrolase of the HAD superfamily
VTSALTPVAADTTPRTDDLEDQHLIPRIQAVCLDIDDTLVDFTSSARKALRTMIGRDDMWPTWQRLTDEHVAKVIAGEMDACAMRVARTKAFLTDLGTPLDDTVVTELEDRRHAEMSETWELFDDVLPCLDWLQAAGLKVAAVTNSSGSHQRVKLNDLGITRFFDAIVIAGELGVAKPDPVIFQAACTQLDVPAAEALHIGDRLEVDALGARDAGLHGVWLDRCGAEPPLDLGVHVIESLGDLPELIVSEYLIPAVTAPSGLPDPRAEDPISSPRAEWSTISDRQYGQ